MATEKICIHCVYFPLCHTIWNVCATHPCKHIGGGSVGFFRPKADEERIRREAIEECARLVEYYFMPGLKLDNRTLEEQVRALAEPRPESRSVVLDAKCNSRGNESHKEES